VTVVTEYGRAVARARRGEKGEYTLKGLQIGASGGTI
jgi:hypothetical protein